MGANNSAPSKPLTFYSETPLQFSQDLVESLETSSNSNAQRTISLTASIEKRVQEDLAELERASSEALDRAIASVSSPSPSNTSVLTTTNDNEPNPRAELEARLEAMKKRLENSVTIGTASAEEARSAVLKCLKEKDRRPLECAEEVKRFREETRRVEREWVERII